MYSTNEKNAPTDLFYHLALCYQKDDQIDKAKEFYSKFLANSKVKSQEISAKVAEAEKTEVLIDESRNMYRPVAYRGSIL